MSTAPAHPCPTPHCGRLTTERYCRTHTRAREQARGTAHQRGYTVAWHRAAHAFLARQRWCIDCQAEGEQVRATVVDHQVPHKGDPVVFWDEGNWRPRCKPHHDRKTATQDGGFGR